MTIKFTFHIEKAYESIRYLATKIELPSVTQIYKLLYFADKSSLERSGRFISGSSYFVTDQGPIPVEIFDILEGVTTKAGRRYFKRKGYAVQAVGISDLDEFSDSDIEYLNQTLRDFGDKPIWYLIQLSQDRAWERAWRQQVGKGNTPLPVDYIVSTLHDSGNLLDHLHVYGY